jgi:hypothetical protein
MSKDGKIDYGRGYDRYEEDIRNHERHARMDLFVGRPIEVGRLVTISHDLSRGDRRHTAGHRTAAVGEVRAVEGGRETANADGGTGRKRRAVSSMSDDPTLCIDQTGWKACSFVLGTDPPRAK